MTDPTLYKPGCARAVRRRVNLLLFDIDTDRRITTAPDGTPKVR